MTFSKDLYRFSFICIRVLDAGGFLLFAGYTGLKPSRCRGAAAAAASCNSQPLATHLGLPTSTFHAGRLDLKTSWS